MLELVKMALRITTDAFDEELNMLIEAAFLDLTTAGVNLFTAATSDDLVKMAVCTYCKLNFGVPDDADRLADRLANYCQTLTASIVARIAFHICDFATQKPQEPTTPTDPTNGKANTTEATTSDENVPAEGLELVEIADGAAGMVGAKSPNARLTARK